MDWNALITFIDPKLLVVVACCWVLGYVLKQTPRVPDWTIIYIVTAFAIVVVIWLQGVSPDSIFQGILCGAVSVYAHQLLKQGKEGTKDAEQISK
jgi:hypothetical protein